MLPHTVSGFISGAFILEMSKFFTFETSTFVFVYWPTGDSGMFGVGAFVNLTKGSSGLE